MESLSKKLIELRKEHKITQEELSKKIGVSRTTLVNYENGRRKPDYEILQRIADYFEVSTDFLLGRDENEFTQDEETFLRDINWPVDKLKEKYDFGDLNDEEIAEAILYIKMKRMMSTKK